MSYYESRDILMFETQQKTDGTTLIKYNTSSESLYFSPGIDLKKSKDFTQVQIVRCNIKASCKPQFKSTWGGDSYSVSLPPGNYQLDTKVPGTSSTVEK